MKKLHLISALILAVFVNNTFGQTAATNEKQWIATGKAERPASPS